VVVALQSQAGVDVITVRGVILADATGRQLDMTTIVIVPRELPAQIRLTQQDGDVTTLVQRTAEAVCSLCRPIAWRSPISRAACKARPRP
jgi:hypothetical protein